MIGIIVEESLKDKGFIDGLSLISVSVSDVDRPEDSWHLYKVDIDESKIGELAKQLKSEKCTPTSGIDNI